MVVHGHIEANGKKVDIPSYRVKIGETISLREKSRLFKRCSEAFAMQGAAVGYLDKDGASMTGRIVRVPSRDEIPVEVKDSKVLEYYSRN
jgi:small subunit ribosomal protein S4